MRTPWKRGKLWLSSQTANLACLRKFQIQAWGNESRSFCTHPPELIARCLKSWDITTAFEILMKNQIRPQSILIKPRSWRSSLQHLTILFRQKTLITIDSMKKKKILCNWTKEGKFQKMSRGKYHLTLALKGTFWVPGRSLRRASNWNSS